MNKNLTSLKRFFQRFYALRPVTWLMSHILHHADALMLRLSGGRLTFAQFSGLPIIELTTTGARSGKQRRLPLACYSDGENIILIASNFGQKHYPSWYHNLKANPECLVTKIGHTGAYIAREADEQENEYYFNMAVEYYSGYAAYKQRAKNRRVPVMILEPKK